MDRFDRGMLLRGHAIGRRAVVDRPRHARDIPLAGRHVSLDGEERCEQRLVAILRVEIGHPRIEIVGANRMADRRGRLAKRDSILVVVAADVRGNERPNLDEPFGEFPISGIPGGAVELGHAHAVAGADGVASEFLRLLAGKFLEVVSRLPAAVEKRGLARGPVMHARRRHQVAHVVGLEVLTIGKLRRGIGSTSLPDDRGRVQVAIFSLGLGDHGDHLIDVWHTGRLPRRCRVWGGHGLGLHQRLEPFQEITVVKRGTMRPAISPALSLAGGHEEVVPGMALRGIAEHVPEIRNHRGAAGGEPLAKQSARPADVVEIGHVHDRLGRSRGIDEAAVASPRRASGHRDDGTQRHRHPDGAGHRCRRRATAAAPPARPARAMTVMLDGSGTAATAPSVTGGAL